MKTTRKKTCGRGQGCTKIPPPVKVQEFYQPSINKDQKINEDRFMRSAAAAQRRIDFEKEMARRNMEYNDMQNLRAMSRTMHHPHVIRNTIRRQGHGRGKKTRLKIIQ